MNPVRKSKNKHFHNNTKLREKQRKFSNGVKINTDIKKIRELLSRGVEKTIDRERLLKKLMSGNRLRIKHGIDPTGPKIHLGRATSLWKLRDFQNLGHQVVLIIGDFTAQIGDASDKKASRRILTLKEIKENMGGYMKQIGKIIDIKKTEVRYNSEWLDKFSARDLLGLSMNFTAQQLIQRRNFKERWEEGKEIGLHELDYPLLQGYDSVAVRASVEIGGSDQLFNLLTGRKIQEIFNQEPQEVMTLEMLYGLDGRKMSTSWGNVINIIDPPIEQYGKVMSMKDELIINYLKLATRLPFEEIKELEKGLLSKRISPRDIKAKLAREIAVLYHGAQTALRVEEEFNEVFKKKGLPSKIPTIVIKNKSLNILDFLVRTKLVLSKAEAKRLILQKGIKIDGKIQDDWQEIIKIKKGQIAQIGKRKFIKII